MIAEEEEEEHIENEENNQEQQEKEEEDRDNESSSAGGDNIGVIINSNGAGRTVTLRQSNAADEIRSKQIMRMAENAAYQPYNLSDHSANIRVKYSRMNAGGREEQDHTTASPHHTYYQSYNASSVFGGAYQYVPVS